MLSRILSFSRILDNLLFKLPRHIFFSHRKNTPDKNMHPAQPMPKSAAPAPVPVTTATAIDQWLDRCAFDRCDEPAQRQLAALARRVLSKLSAHGIHLIPHTPQREDAFDSTAWTVFEGDLKRGFANGGPEVELLLKHLNTRTPTTRADWLRRTSDGLEDLLPQGFRDSAKPETLEKKILQRFEKTLARLHEFALIDEPTPDSFLKLGSAVVSLQSDTVFSTKFKAALRARPPRKPVGHLKRIIARRLVATFQPESSRALRLDGKFRTRNGEVLKGVSFDEFPDEVAWEIASLEPVHKTMVEMPLGDDPEPLLRQGRELAAEEFQKMKKGKIPTRLVACAAKLQSMPLSSPVVLKACGVTHPGAPANTLRRDFRKLRARVKKQAGPQWRIVASGFVEELMRLVQDWIATEKPFGVPAAPAPGARSLTPTAPTAPTPIMP